MNLRFFVWTLSCVMFHGVYGGKDTKNMTIDVEKVTVEDLEDLKSPRKSREEPLTLKQVYEAWYKMERMIVAKEKIVDEKGVSRNDKELLFRMVIKHCSQRYWNHFFADLTELAPNFAHVVLKDKSQEKDKSKEDKKRKNSYSNYILKKRESSMSKKLTLQINALKKSSTYISLALEEHSNQPFIGDLVGLLVLNGANVTTEEQKLIDTLEHKEAIKNSIKKALKLRK